jgi:hypothetical protein
MTRQRQRSLAVGCRLWALTVVIGLSSQAAALGAADSSVAWLTGNELEVRLAEPVGVDWAERSLREALTGLSRAKQVAVFLDRRVDPDQTLQMSLKEAPLGDVFRQVAASRGLGVSHFGPVIYLGPARFTARLRTLAALRLEDVRRLPAEAGLRYVRTQRMAWDDLAEPRRLLERVTRENGLELSGLEKIPHDLWAAADLPPLSLVDRLTLLAGQFDLTFQITGEGRKVVLVPIPAKVSIVRSYPAGRQADAVMEKWAALAPQCRIARDGSRIVVEGLVEDHERIVAADRPTTSRPAMKPAEKENLASKRFTVREANGPLKGLLEELARRLNLEWKIDREALDRAGVSLDKNIIFSVEDATLDQLLDAVLKPAGCTFRRHDKTVEILPAEADE